MTTNPTPLTIGLVIDDSLDRPDGVQQHVLTLGRWLTGKGHTVHYLTSTTQRTDIPRIHSLAKNLPITFNGNRLGIPLPADRSAIRQLFTDVHFDVLHINMPYSPLLAGAIINAAPATTRIVGTFHIMPWSTLTKVGTHALGQSNAVNSHASTRSLPSPNPPPTSPPPHCTSPPPLSGTPCGCLASTKHEKQN